MADRHPLIAAFDIVKEDATDTNIGEILDSLVREGLGPFWLLLAALVITPLASIPGVPATVGILLLLFSTQKLMKRTHLWFPQRIRDIQLKSIRVEQFLKLTMPTIRWLARFIKPRHEILAHGVLPGLIVALMTTILGFGLIVIGFIPFVRFILGIPLFVFALAYSARDGVLMILAYFTFGGFGVLLFWFFGGFS